MTASPSMSGIIMSRRTASDFSTVLLVDLQGLLAAAGSQHAVAATLQRNPLTASKVGNFIVDHQDQFTIAAPCAALADTPGA